MRPEKTQVDGADPARASTIAVMTDVETKPPETWTSRVLIKWMTDRFAACGLDAPRVVAEMLLAHVLKCDRMRLYMEVERAAKPDELTTLRGLVARASRNEPVHYLVGRASFFGREFHVDRSTMIPQPSTEDLVTAVIERARAGGFGGPPPRKSADVPEAAMSAGASDPEAPESDLPDAPASSPGPSSRGDGVFRVADIGTGSGCVAAAVALHVPAARIVATDVATDALDLARRNLETLGVADRVTLREGSLLDPLRDMLQDGADAGTRFDVICANLPYIPDNEWEGGDVQPAVRDYVPERALRGGADGLDLIRPLIAAAGGLLADDGAIVLEIAHAHRDAAVALVEETPGLHRPEVRRDYEGLWRILIAERAQERAG